MSALIRRNLLTIAAATVAISGLVASMRPSNPMPPERPLDDLLHECFNSRDLTTEQAACRDASRRLIADGRKSEAVDALNRACSGHKETCVTLALMYLFGDGVEPDEDRAMSLLGRAGDNGDARGWTNLLLLQRGERSRTARNREERSLHYACSHSDAGWPCYNYGVALACGYFGPPDLKVAHWAFFRGCDRGDERSCDLSARFQTAPAILPCNLISPHPKFPYPFELDIVPADPDEELPDSPDLFRRRAFSR